MTCRSSDPRPTDLRSVGLATLAARRPAGLVTVLVAALVLAHAAGTIGAAAEGDDVRPLDVVVTSTQHWVGTNDVLVSLYDPTGRSLAEDAVPVWLELRAPDGDGIRVAPAVERFATYGRHVYRARVPLDQVGTWEVHAEAEVDGHLLTGSTSLEAAPDQGTPPLGSRVPGGDTPTMRDAHSLMHHISSDPQPLTAFYTWSLDDALAQGQPTVFVLDSYAFRPNAACGGALGILHEVFIDYPGLTFIHAEPWHMTPGHEGGMLELDPPGGPAELTDYARAWGMEEPPWVFVIDRDGRLHAKFSGVIGSDELRAAMASVSSWEPVGG